MSITVKVKGARNIERLIRRLGEEGEAELDAETFATAEEIATDAKKLAPVNDGLLQQSIGVAKGIDTRNVIAYSVGASAPYAGYVEFGTGSKVEVPKEFNDLAQQWKGRKGGSFKEGLESIKDWVRKKGLPEESAYPIFVKILREGSEPQPFLYPAFVLNKQEYIQNIKNVLNRLTKKLS